MLYVFDFVFSVFVEVEVLASKGVQQTDAVSVEGELEVYGVVLCIIELQYFERVVVVEAEVFLESE